MKTSWLTIALLVLTVIRTQGQDTQSGTPAIASQGMVPDQDTPYAVVDRGANHRVWQRTIYETRPDGRQIPYIHKYTELASGLNHLVNGGWVESREEIDILPDGTAAATQGQHQAYFPGNIYRGEIRLVTSDGKQLRSRPVGLSYFDGNKSVLIAELKDSTGWLVGSNQVIYPDALTDFKADLRYTYTKAGFEQDIILREQPPSPASFGLNPDTTRLQVLTEFFNPPQPGVTATAVPTDAGNLEDDNLDFGTMQVGRGRAFLLGTSSPAVGVNKQWLQLEGRQFLVEEVPVASITDELDTLPKATTQAGSKTTSHTVAKTLILPPQRLAGTGTKTLWVAKSSLPSHGLVLDYVTLNSSRTNYTFQGDTTYYISGAVNLYGTNNNLEGGTVLKYATNNSAAVNMGSGVVLKCQTAPYRPAILTSKDDNSVGETIAGSTGNPIGNGYNSSYGLVWSDNASVHDLRASYLYYGVCLMGGGLVRNAQFIQCYSAVDYFNYGNQLSMENVLVQGGVQAMWPITGGGGLPVFCVNCTFHNVGQLISNFPFPVLTNCLVAGIWNTNGTVWNMSAVNNSVITNDDTGIFQTVGAGAHYLATNSPYRNAGTTNIDPTLLADLQQKTTYPPVIYSNTTISTPMTFSPQAQRDNDMPDLGYHYDPLDYIFGSVVTSTNLTFTAGTAVGWFDHSGYGISLPNSINVNFNGTVTAPCIFTHYTTVQEGNAVNWAAQSGFAFGMAAIGAIDDPNYAPLIMAQFTHFSQLAIGHIYFRDYTIQLHFQGNDCEFYNGGEGGYGMWLCLTNCLFDREYLGLQAQCCAQMAMQNCTLHGGNMLITHWGDWPVTIINSAFDGTIFNMDARDAYCDYNAFLTNANLTAVMGGHEVTNLVSYNWQSSWLGNYYLPTNSLLIDMGNTNANLLGLYHFTTQTNQVKETNSIVDIGYHYVAVDAYGNPIDTDGDGVPDYLEDANGNGSYDAGDLGDWQTGGSVNGPSNGVLTFPNGLILFIFEPKPTSNVP
jgi:hypothetical protein